MSFIYTSLDIYYIMPKKSKIDIFNVMTEEELDEALESLDYPIRYYQRLIAMKLISTGHNHKETGEILRISYRSINRWAKACEKNGLDGLIPNFSGGKPSKLSEENKVQFKQILIEGENLTMTDAQRILKDDFGIEFSLPHVCNIVRQLGFNYGKPRPKFREAPENGEEILKKTLILQE